MNEDIRTLSKWLNEESTAPIDRQALARVLAFSQQAQPVYLVASSFLEGAPYTWRIVRKGFYERYPEDNRRILYTTPQPQPAPPVPAPVDEREAFDEAFNLVFEAYAKPADNFDSHEQWAIWQHGKVIKAFGLLQRFRATLSQPAPLAGEVTDEQREKVMDAIAEMLGDAYDCTRVWEAWSVGTMSQDDFSVVRDDQSRLAEIADAAILALRPQAVPMTDAWSWLTEANIDAYLEDYEMRGEDEAGHDACYTPTEGDRALLKDFVMGLLTEAQEAAHHGITAKAEGGA